MGRRKLPMELIADETSRRKSLKVRKECVLKKADELKTLCGVHDTCVIIYDDQNSNFVTTYPENRDRVKQIVGRYLSANRTVTMKKKKNETQKRKMEKKVLDDDDDVIGSLSWEELKCLDDTLAAREVAATRKREEARTRMMIRRQQQLHNLLMMDDNDDIGEADVAALNDVMLDYSSLI